MENNFCCDQMKNAIANESIICEGKYCIRSKPEVIGDEETGYDDMTDEIEIQYCPFCGGLFTGESMNDKTEELTAFTDYPLMCAGDMPFVPTAMRKVLVIGYDNNKYVRVQYGGCEETIKRGYLYTDETGDTVVSEDALAKLPREW